VSKIKKRKLSNPFLIGFFVVAGVLIILTTIIWLGANHFLQENIKFVTYFDNSVQGLETGSPVKYLGVPVGSISKINLAPDGKLVEVVMDINKSLAINDTMRIKAEMAGISGGKFLQIYYPNDPVIGNMNPQFIFEPKYKYIKSTPSGIQEIELALREAMNNLMKIKTGEISDATISFLESTTQFFSNEKLYGIIAELQNSSITLSKVLSRADSSNIINNLSATTAQLKNTVDVLKVFSEDLNQKLNDLQLKKHTDNTFSLIDTTIIDARKIINNIGYRSENMMYSINEIIEDLKSTNKSLQKSIKALNTSPSQIFLSEPPPEEK
jgi:phospholipid/cholesterol/gamma-HCH transport system substrate-binding protein